ncbi:ATP-dependent DNA helicase PcrA [bioreactor metagenome]|uniref:ATP-dependent DNA helicase PcrA n=1 Tax=bioreactor metagenome TaxID=1076179 RepID=A0A645DT76_9ZZZZ
MQEFRELIESFRDRLVTDNAYQIGTDIIRRSGIMTDIHADNSPESLSRQENIEELVNGLQDFCALRMEEGSTDISLSDYLSDIALLTDQDSDKDNEGAKVVLMTVHSAKGLEFRNVFVVGMEENLFPGSMAGDSPRAMEEERRLFYVAITRAEEHCYLSYARTRFRYGKMEFGTPSRFLRDIDTCFLDLPHEAGIGHKVDEGAARFRKEEVRQQIRPRAQVIAPTLPRNLKKVANSSTENQSAQSMQTSLGELRVGQNIQHERFGMGEVTKLEGSGDNAKATIRFRHAGEKQLLLRFARFTVID